MRFASARPIRPASVRVYFLRPTDRPPSRVISHANEQRHDITFGDEAMRGELLTFPPHVAYHPIMNNTCKTCGKPCKRQWCSQACNAISRQRKEERVCPSCEKTFLAKTAEVNRGNGIYCSIPCRRKHQAEHCKGYLVSNGKRVHIAVAEEKLGRPLRHGETVHHQDTNRLNNHPDNLIVFGSQSEHILHEIATGQRIITHEHAVLMGRRSWEVRRAREKGDTSPAPASNNSD